MLHRWCSLFQWNHGRLDSCPLADFLGQKSPDEQTMIERCAKLRWIGAVGPIYFTTMTLKDIGLRKKKWAFSI